MKDCIKKIDKPLFIIATIFTLFGLIMVFSASNIAAVLQFKYSEYYFFQRQAIFILIGFIATLFIIRIPLEKYKLLSLSGMGVIGIIMFIMRTKGITGGGATSWFNVFGFTFQPSEFAKTIMILFLASTYGSRKQYKNYFDAFIPLAFCAIIVGFVALEPDFGTATIMTSVCAFIFFSLPFNKDKYMTILKVGVAAVVILAVILSRNPDNMAILADYQKERLTYTNPCDRYLEDTGYQVCNGYIAINNGGLFGVGLGKSTQKYLYLPEAHTDFIFPIIVEELGIIGGACVLIAYILVLLRVLIIARNAKSLTGSIVAFGTFSYILMHIVVNMGGLLALMPLTGVPLPFLSYGGSFMINLLILLALTQRVAIESKQKKVGK